jgi:outer membrane protein
MYNVVSAYYDIVQQKQVLNSINEVINYNKQRVTIAQTGFNAGTLAKTDFLQAQIDLNVSMENAVNQRFAINEAEKSLNILLGQDATIPISVSDSIPLSQAPDKNEMLLKIESANANLQALKKQIDVANLAIKEAQKNYLPTLNLQGEMFLNGNHYSEGSTTRNRTHGMQIGGTLSIPLYNGGETKRKISLARNELLNAQLNLDNERLQINRELQNSYNDYENQLQLLQIEKQNNQLAKENMDICLQRLKLGQTTSLEVHQSQESYAQSSTRLINFEYNVKLQETRLKQLIADL